MSCGEYPDHERWNVEFAILVSLPREQVWALGTANPAAILGLNDVGTLMPGARADLVLWNEDLTPARVWVGGKTVLVRFQTT